VAATDQIENAIRSMLIAGAGITGVPSSRVTHAYRGPSQGLPAVTYDVVGIEDQTMGSSIIRAATVEYRVIAETVLAALDIIDLIEAKNVPTTVGTVVIRAIVWQNRVAEAPQVSMGDEAAPAEVVATALVYFQG